MQKTNQVQLVHVDELQLDIQNPRIRKWIEMYGDKPTAEQLYLALGAGSSDPESGSTTTFNTLKQSIQTNGGIIQPVIVNQDATGKMIVVEGNTRVAIYRDFKSNGTSGSWDLIPAIVHSQLDKRGIDAIRLQAHLVGPRPWDPYSKAKYLHSLRDNDNLPLSEIIDYCGGRKKEIIEYIDAYIDMEKHYRAIISDDSAFDTTRFSAFIELQKSGVKEAILTSGYTIDDFAKWVDQRLIDPLNSVRSIPQILANPEAKKVFLKDGAKEAKKLLDSPPPSSVKDLSLDQLLQAVIMRINQIQYNEVKRIRANPTSNTAQLIAEAHEEIINLYNDVNNED